MAGPLDVRFDTPYLFLTFFTSRSIYNSFDIPA